MVFSVKDFCRFAQISPSMYFQLQRDGEGPRVTRIRGRVLIAKDTAEAWLKNLEASTPQGVR